MKDIKDIVNKLTLEEKISLLRGADTWHTAAIERLGIPSFLMTDGPVGLRCENPNSEKADEINAHDSYPCTCFPSESMMSATFNEELIGEIGVQLGKEARYFGVNILLGPGINHKRLPNGGRNFEYFSEDPVLPARLATAYVRGVQSQGVGCCVKHFFANNTEYNRHSIDIRMDERTMYEIYLKAFAYVINHAMPFSVMSAYNKVFGDHCSESSFALQEILRKELGFEGAVISDWGAVHDKVKSVRAGCDIEMNSDYSLTDGQLQTSLKNGDIDVSYIDEALGRIFALYAKLTKEQTATDPELFEKGYALALKAALEGIVLLKNEGEILPLKTNDDFCVLGEAAVKPMIQGAGSARVNSLKTSSSLKTLRTIFNNIAYAETYGDDEKENERLLSEAVALAKKCKKVLLFIKNDEYSEREEEDRKNLSLGERNLRMIDAVCNANPNTVVILQVGAAVEMPFIEKAKAVVLQGFGGSASGEAVAKILAGQVCPSGRLSETYPLRYSDNPAFDYYAYNPDEMEYREGVLTGYRYYDTKGVSPLFPFGYGLSYTKFEYTNPTVRKNDQTIELSVEVKNCGETDGKETVMLYFSKQNSKILRASKQLIAFTKVDLKAGESKRVMLSVNASEFAYWDSTTHSFQTEQGTYQLMWADYMQKPTAVIEITLP